MEKGIHQDMRVLITGGAGFIGTNACEYFLKKGDRVIAMDNLSRPGSESNLKYLTDLEYRNFKFIHHDISQPLPYMLRPDLIIHLAAQVGVQASIKDPVRDFEDNVLGTLNVLEFSRAFTHKPVVMYSSTNKGYGDIQVNRPVSEKVPLDFHTPYGVSKGAADQYVLDYFRIYDVPTVVFRQSCIYGPHQNGSEEQGWVAWFLKADHKKLPITIFGHGNQVRDVLYVDDLIKLYDKAYQGINRVKGKAYNIGGGPDNILSLNGLVEKASITTQISFESWRPADQVYYVSDIDKIEKDLLWRPTVGVDEGLDLLKGWISESS